MLNRSPSLDRHLFAVSVQLFLFVPVLLDELELLPVLHRLPDNLLKRMSIANLIGHCFDAIRP